MTGNFNTYLNLTRHCEKRSDEAIWLGPDDCTVEVMTLLIESNRLS